MKSTAAVSHLRWGSLILNSHDFNLPLGWLLAPSTRKLVELHSGFESSSTRDFGGVDEENKFSRILGYAQNDDRTACEVEALLSAASGGRC